MVSPLKISMTASLALRSSGNHVVAMVVGMNGAKRIVTSVMLPSVPSAPTNSFLVSNPAADLRARHQVLINSPDGKTTVCLEFSVRARPTDNAGAHCIQEPFALRRTIPHHIGCVKDKSVSAEKTVVVMLNSGAASA